MNKTASPIAIGAFVIGAMVLTIVAVLVFSSGNLFTKTVGFVTVFPEAVDGLQIDSAVELKGVNIGTVKDIRLMVDDTHTEVSVPVYLEITPNVIVDQNFKELVLLENKSARATRLNELIEKGLRARLKQKSFVTGQMVVALDFHDDAPIVLTGIDKQHLEIPAIVSTTTQMVSMLQDLPLRSLIEKATDTLDSIGEILRSQAVKSTVTDISTLTAEAVKFLRDLDVEFKGVSKDASAAMTEALLAMKNVNSIVNKKSATRVNLDDTLKELSRAARSLRVLADYLEQHPDAIIKGK